MNRLCIRFNDFITKQNKSYRLKSQRKIHESYKAMLLEYLRNDGKLFAHSRSLLKTRSRFVFLRVIAFLLLHFVLKFFFRSKAAKTHQILHSRIQAEFAGDDVNVAYCSSSAFHPPLRLHDGLSFATFSISLPLQRRLASYASSCLSSFAFQTKHDGVHTLQRLIWCRNPLLLGTLDFPRVKYLLSLTHLCDDHEARIMLKVFQCLFPWARCGYASLRILKV